jgi:hypothetical protein
MPHMASKRKKSTPKYERLSDQIVVRVKPSTRVRLEAHAKKEGLRGVGEVVRELIEQHDW